MTITHRDATGLEVGRAVNPDDSDLESSIDRITTPQATGGTWRVEVMTPRIKIPAEADRSAYDFGVFAIYSDVAAFRLLAELPWRENYESTLSRVDEATARANAELICASVNAHAGLVELLNRASKRLDGYQRSYEIDDGNDALAVEIRAALAAAGGAS